MGKKNAQRQKVLKEIVETEQRYVKQLNTLVSEFASNANVHATLTPGQVTALFGNVTFIAEFHKMFLQDLKTTKSIAEAFKKSCDFLLMYIDFVNTYDVKVIGTFEKLKSNSAFMNIVAKKRDSGKCDLMSSMILPVQRVPRYEMLLKELSKHTPDNHAEKETIIESLDKISGIAARINEGKRKFENLQKVQAIHGYDELVQPDRFLLHDGNLTKGRGAYPFYLFTDILLYTNDKGAVQGVTSLVNAVVSVEEHKHPGKFSVRGEDVLTEGDSTNDWSILADKDSYDTWVSLIKGQILSVSGRREELESRIATDKANKAARAEIEQLQKDIADLHQQVFQLESKQANADDESLDEERQAWEAERSLHEAERLSWENEAAQLRLKIDEARLKSRAEVHELKANVASQKNKDALLAASKLVAQELGESVLGLEKKLGAATADLSDAKSEALRLSQELETVRSQLRVREAASDNAAEVRETFEKETNEMRKMFEQMNHEVIEQCEKEKQELVAKMTHERKMLLMKVTKEKADMTKEFTREKSDLTARFEKEREEAVDFAQREEELQHAFESEKAELVSEHKRDMLLVKQEAAKELSQELAKLRTRLQAEGAKSREADVSRLTRERGELERDHREKIDALKADHEREVGNLERKWSDEKEHLESSHKFQISKLQNEVESLSQARQEADRELASHEADKENEESMQREHREAIAKVQARLDAQKSEWHFERSSMQAEWRREKAAIEERHEKAAQQWQKERSELEARHQQEKKTMEEGFQREKSLMRQMFHRENARRFERQASGLRLSVAEPSPAAPVAASGGSSHLRVAGGRTGGRTAATARSEKHRSGGGATSPRSTSTTAAKPRPVATSPRTTKKYEAASPSPSVQTSSPKYESTPPPSTWQTSASSVSSPTTQSWRQRLQSYRISHRKSQALLSPKSAQQGKHSPDVSPRNSTAAVAGSVSSISSPKATSRQKSGDSGLLPIPTKTDTMTSASSTGSFSSDGSSVDHSSPRASAEEGSANMSATWQKRSSTMPRSKRPSSPRPKIDTTSPSSAHANGTTSVQRPSSNPRPSSKHRRANTSVTRRRKPPRAENLSALDEGNSGSKATNSHSKNATSPPPSPISTSSSTTSTPRSSFTRNGHVGTPTATGNGSFSGSAASNGHDDAGDGGSGVDLSAGTGMTRHLKGHKRSRTSAAGRGSTAGSSLASPSITSTVMGWFGGGKKSETASSKVGKSVQSATPRCPRCEKPAYFSESVQFEDASWHRACFKCSKCKTRLTVGLHKSYQGDPYCFKCFRTF